MEFEWDIDKAERNLKVHGVSFDEATKVFSDTLSSTVPDPDHSEGEFRWLIFGQTFSSRHLVVSFAERSDRIRIISAREMTRNERKAYEQ